MMLATAGHSEFQAASASSLPDDLMESVQQTGDGNSWMLTYLDVFVLTAALFATLLLAQPQEEAVAQWASQLPSTVEMEVAGNRATLHIGESVLFPPAEASITPSGLAVINDLVPLLQKVQGTIIVQGHTDSIPIQTEAFPTNWELGSARALSVLHHLIEEGLSGDHLRAMSMADTEPRSAESSPQARALNRRVSIVLELPGSSSPATSPTVEDIHEPPSAVPPTTS